MSTTISDLVQAYQNNAKQTNSSQGKATGLDIAAQRAAQYGVEISASSTSKTVSQQSSIITSLFGNKDTAPSDALKLTYQAAISKLNDILTTDQGSSESSSISSDAAPISEATLQQQGGMEYWSPENTANRIVSGATSFLSGFQKIHPELEGQALMDKFNEVVGGGLQQGFDEAKGILTNLKVFDGQIADNYNSTLNLVTQGMQNFTNQYLGISTDNSNSDSETTADNTSKTDESEA